MLKTVSQEGAPGMNVPWRNMCRSSVHSVTRHGKYVRIHSGSGSLYPQGARSPWELCPLGVLGSWYILLGVLGASPLELKSKRGYFRRQILGLCQDYVLPLLKPY